MMHNAELKLEIATLWKTVSSYLKTLKTHRNYIRDQNNFLHLQCFLLRLYSSCQSLPS